MGLARMMAMLGLDTSQYEAGFKRVESFSTGVANRLSKSIKGYLAAAFSVGAVTMYARSLLEAGGRIKDLSDKIGVSAETLQEWEYAAKQSGAQLDDFSRAFVYLAKTNPGKTTDELVRNFNAIADAVQSGKFGSSEIATVTQLLGKAGVQIIPAFKSGLRESAQAARELGGVLSNDVVNGLDEMGDRLEDLKLSLRGPAAQGLASVGGKVLDYVNYLVEAHNKLEATTKGGRQSGWSESQSLALGYMMLQKLWGDVSGKEQPANPRKSKLQPWSGGDLGLGIGSASPEKFDWVNSKSGNVAIGAYSGVNPLIVAQKETNTKLDKINKTLERIQADGSIPT